VLEQVNKSLLHWICNQKTYLRLYQEKKKDGGKFHIDDHYVISPNKLGLGTQVHKF
jgi:hypothetical protein